MNNVNLMLECLECFDKKYFIQSYPNDECFCEGSQELFVNIDALTILESFDVNCDFLYRYVEIKSTWENHRPSVLGYGAGSDAINDILDYIYPQAMISQICDDNYQVVFEFYSNDQSTIITKIFGKSDITNILLNLVNKGIVPYSNLSNKFNFV